MTKPVQRAAAVLLICCGVLIAYWDSVTGLTSHWGYSAYRHAPFVPFISLFLLWRDRDLFDLPFTGSWRGLVALGLSVALWIIARAVFVQTVEHIAMFCILNAMVWSIAGDRAYKRLAIPLGFLIFAVPIGSEIVPWLMVVTADISAAALDLFNIPFYREAMKFTLPGGRFEVADVCSGVRYLNVGLMIGALVSLLYFRSWTRRALYMTAVPFLFILTNGVRAFLVMAIASATELKYLGGYDHVLFGWVLFFILIVAMVFVADRYSDA